MNTGMTLIFICSYKVKTSDSKQELRLIQIGLNLVRVEFRGIYVEFQDHICTLIWLGWMFHFFFNFYWTITRTTC